MLHAAPVPKTLSPLGAALRAAMDECGKPVKEVARQAGLPGATLYAYRAGTRVPPRDTLDALLNVMNVSDGTVARVYAAAGIDAAADPGDVAADIIRSLPNGRDRRLAIELLRTQARFTLAKRNSEREQVQARAEELLDEAERVTEG